MVDPAGRRRLDRENVSFGLSAPAELEFMQRAKSRQHSLLSEGIFEVEDAIPPLRGEPIA